MGAGRGKLDISELSAALRSSIYLQVCGESKAVFFFFFEAAGQYCPSTHFHSPPLTSLLLLDRRNEGQGGRCDIQFINHVVKKKMSGE